MYLLDSSIIIPYVAAVLGNKEQRRHPRNRAALAFIINARVPVKINVAIYAETLRHYQSAPDVAEMLAENLAAPLPLMIGDARRWARLQERGGNMGDNDAWVAAHAIVLGAKVVGHDAPAFRDRLGVDYIDFMEN
jgi:predicted nucleic acid-binding protein